MDINIKNEIIIRDYIKDKLGKEAKILSRLMGGMSNFTYIIEIENKKYTFRIPGKGSKQFTNREDELLVVQAIDDYDFQPAPIIFDTENGFKLAPYIDGEIVSDLNDKPLDKIAEVLHKLHDIPLFKNDYLPVERLNKYDSITNNKDSVYLALKDKWLEIYENKLSKVPLRATHGDSQTSNFVLKEDKLYLLDWEFAANNDPIYDIACYGNANFDHSLALMQVYFDNPSKNEFERLYAWRMFQCLQWHNVAKYKHQIGLSEDLAVDFDFFAKQYLDKAKGFFQDYLDLQE